MYLVLMVTYSHHFANAKKWELLAQYNQRCKYQRAIPVCPTVLISVYNQLLIDASLNPSCSILRLAL